MVIKTMQIFIVLITQKYFSFKRLYLLLRSIAQQIKIKRYKMGPSASKEQNRTNSEVKLSHPRFKNASLSSEKEEIEVSHHFMHQNQIKIWQQKFTPFLKQQSLLLPTGYESKSSGFCGTDGFCKITYQNYPYNLLQEVKDRINNNLDSFESGQLWYILYVILEAAQIFHSLGIKIGDVRPMNVFISDNGQAKVATQYSFPNENTNFDKSLLDKQVTYLAPQELKHLLFRSQSKQNFILAESFSIGLTLLDAATLNNSEDLYNLKTCRLNYQLLNKRRNDLLAKTKLDQAIKQILLGLTETNQTDRLNCDQIFKRLKPFKEEILNFQHFEILDWKGISNQKSKTNTASLVNGQSNASNANSIPMLRLQLPNGVIPPNKLLTSSQPQIVDFNRLPQNFIDPFKPNQLKYGGYSVSNVQNVQSKGKSINLGPIPTIRGPANDDFRSTLQRIDEQLLKSRQMFPS